MTAQKLYRIGDVTITRIPEITLEDPPAHLYPHWSANLVQERGDQFSAATWNFARGVLGLSVHSWLVRTPHHTVLIDTATGNDKPRPLAPVFDHLDTPYLERLKDAGVTPEQVDFVLLTHLHVDHVGWNTQRVDGAWKPTFPRARYGMPQREYSFYKDPAQRHDVRQIILEDSVYPVVDAGMAVLVGEGGQELLDYFRYVPTPGHSIGHMSLLLESAGEHALLGGDIMHHPFQVYRPEMNSIYCEQPEQAYQSRRLMLEYASANDLLYFSTHFPETSVGRITRTGNGFAWKYE